MAIGEKIARILYGKDAVTSEIQQRYDALKENFHRHFGADNTDFFSASGRTEICGNHTDHNNGKVLVAAIGVDTLAAAAKTDAKKVLVASEGYRDIAIDFNDLKECDCDASTSKALVRGVLAGLTNAGYAIGGANITLCSSVFKGAGVSSSASFELAICEVMNHYYNNGKIPPIEKAKIAQYAENVHFKKPCGLLDQAGIALGSLSEIDFKNVESPTFCSVDADFTGYRIVITNTGGDHSNLTDSYAAIRTDMERVAAYFGKKVLREVDEAEFYRAMPELSKLVGGRAVLRAMHFFDENKRVDEAAEALKSGNLKAFFHAINGSGDSSYKLLQNCYVEGTTAQPIPLALALGKRILGNDGAIRVHGGGFAGTVIAFVPSAVYETYIYEMKRVFGDDNVFTTDIRMIGSTQVDA